MSQGYWKASYQSAGVVNATDSQFGGYWNGTNDDSAALQLACDLAATYSPRKAVMLPPLVAIKSSIFVKARVHIIGYNYSPGKINTRVIPTSDMSLSTGFIFNCNTLDGTTQEEAQTWDARGAWSGIFGIELDNTVNNVAGARLCTFAYTFRAKDLKERRATQLIKRVPVSYADNVEISDVSIHPAYATNAEYQIELSFSGNGGGDAYVLKNIVTSTTDSGDGLPIKAIYCYGGNSGTVTNCINGQILIKNSPGVLINQLHQEYGQVVLTNTSGEIRGMTSQVHDADTYYPIDLTTDTTAQTYQVALTNCIFRKGNVTFDGNPAAEVRLTQYHTLVSLNSYRVLQVAGERCVTGYRVNNSSDAAITAWNSNAGYLSLNGYMTNYVPHGSDIAAIPAADFAGFGTATAVTTNGNGSFSASTTYYYKAQFLLASGIGRNSSAEVSVAVSASAPTALATRIYLSLSYGSTSTVGIVRIYRGTSTNSYDKVVNIPVINARSFGDDGTNIAGIAWGSRGAAAMDTITSVMGTYRVDPYSLARLYPTTNAKGSGSSPTIDFGSGNFITFTSTGNTTWNAPSNVPPSGEPVYVQITQDGTGGRTQTWNAAFKGAWPTASGTGGQIQLITGRSDGTNLVFISASGWY